MSDGGGGAGAPSLKLRAWRVAVPLLALLAVAGPAPTTVCALTAGPDTGVAAALGLWMLLAFGRILFAGPPALVRRVLAERPALDDLLPAEMWAGLFVLPVATAAVLGLVQRGAHDRFAHRRQGPGPWVRLADLRGNVPVHSRGHRHRSACRAPPTARSGSGRARRYGSSTPTCPMRRTLQQSPGNGRNYGAGRAGGSQHAASLPWARRPPRLRRHGRLPGRATAPVDFWRRAGSSARCPQSSRRPALSRSTTGCRTGSGCAPA